MIDTGPKWQRVYIDGEYVDYVRGLNDAVHIGQRLEITRLTGLKETFRVESVTNEEVRLRRDDPGMDFATRVEAGLWGSK